MSNTKNMSSLYLGGNELDFMESSKYPGPLYPETPTYEEIENENKGVSFNQISKIYREMSEKPVNELRKHIYTELIKIPKEIDLIAKLIIINGVSCDSFRFTGLGGNRTYTNKYIHYQYDHEWIDLNFKKYLIEKYNLDEFQMVVLETVKDLLDVLYSEYEVIQIQSIKDGNLKHFIYDGSLGNKIIKTLKLLVNNSDMYDMRLNNFSLLVNNYLFYMDIEKLLEEYNNLTIDDIKRITFVSKDNFYKVVSLLNSCDKELRGKILYLMEPLKSDSEIFPCLIDDVILEDGFEIRDYLDRNKVKSKTITIIDKNNWFFNKYNYFFYNEIDYFKLVELVKNNSEIINFLIALKKNFIYSIPTLIDTRFSYSDYETVHDIVPGEPWHEVSWKEKYTVSIGELYVGEDIINKYIEVIMKVCESINKGESISIDDLYYLDMDIDTYKFYLSTYGMFTMNKLHKKVKVRKVEYLGNKPGFRNI